MRNFEYGDKYITEREIFYAVPSMVIGIGILFLPRLLAKATNFSDGYISIIITGIIGIIITWLIASLPSRFPGQSFYHYTSLIVTKPISAFLTIMIGLHFILFTAYEIRMVATIAKLYLFELTPIEAISLIFLLVVVYCVSGRRVALLRLNMMFLPIIIIISLILILLNVGLMEPQNLFPFFKTSFKSHIEGIGVSYFSFASGGILLFYVSLVKKPTRVPKYAGLSLLIPLVLYTLIHITCVLVFSYKVTGSLLFPTIELAKEVQIPGGFFERFESIFFTIWIMAIFNTTAMAFDITLFSLSSVFVKIKKMTWIYILSPIIYLLTMMPQNFNTVTTLGEYLSFAGVILTTIIPLLLLIIAKIRGVKGNEEN